MKRILLLGVLVLVAAASIGAGCGGGVKVQGVNEEDQGEGGGSGAPSSTGAGKQCSAVTICGPTEYCASCDEIPHCEPRPDPCNWSGHPVCGCDGKVYEGICVAIAAGIGTTTNAICEEPAGTFKCGTYFCTIGTEFCRWEFELSPVCAPLPSECQGENANCECVEPPTGEGGSGGTSKVPGCGGCEPLSEGIGMTCVSL